MKHLSPEARRLFQLARQEDEPGQDALQRVERSLAGRLASGIGVAAASAFWTKSAAGLIVGTSKLVAVTLVIGAASVVGIRAMQGSRPAPNTATIPQGDVVRPVALKSSAAPSAAAFVASPVDEPAPAPSPGLNRVAPRPASSAPSVQVDVVDPPDQLREETRELRAAQQALRAGDAARALSLLNEQDQRFQPGQLQEERSAARVLALCQGGQVDRARSEATRFEQRWPKSALVARVRSSCF